MSTKHQHRIGEALDAGKRATSIAHRTVRQIHGDQLGRVGLYILAGFLLVGLAAPWLAPHDPDATQRGDDGSVVRLEGPSASHPFGTTHLGQDVLSQVIVSTRVSLIVGFLAAFMSVFIGTNIGLIGAYYGGWVDDALMRITDLAYGIPFLPFVIVLVILLGTSLFNVIIAISLIQWRGTARVIRSQVLSHKERPYVESAEAIGASDVRIMYRHILPNVLPITFIYAAFAVGWAIIAQASVAFLGYGDPALNSWGKMIFEAYNTGVIERAWWWVVPAGIAIILLVISVFFIERSLEEIINPELRHKQ